MCGFYSDLQDKDVANIFNHTYSFSVGSMPYGSIDNIKMHFVPQEKRQFHFR